MNILSKHIIKSFLLLFIIKSSFLFSQTYNSQTQNRTWSSNNNINTVFFKSSGVDLTITPNLNMIQFVDSNGATYGYNGDNDIPSNWTYEILDGTGDVPANTTVSADKKTITFTADPDEDLDIYLKISDNNGNVIDNLSRVQLRLYIRGNLTVATAKWNACEQAYVLSLNEQTRDGTKLCAPYRIIVYKVVNGSIDTNTVIYDSNSDNNHNVNSNTFSLSLGVGSYAAAITNSCNERVNSSSDGYYYFSVTEAYTFGATSVFSGYQCITDNFGTTVIKVEGAAKEITWELKNSSDQVILTNTDTNQYTLENYNDQFDTQNFTITIPNLAEGTYTFTFTDGNSCTEDLTFKVEKPEEIETSVLENDSKLQLDCYGDSDGKITFLASGGWTEPWDGNYINPNGWGDPYTFTLTKGGTTYSSGDVLRHFVNGNQTGYKTSFTGLSAGSYTLTVTENVATNPYNSNTIYYCAKVFEQTFTISQPDELTSSASVTNVDCNGNDNGSIDLSVAGGTANYTYAWTKTGDNSYSATTQDLSDLSPGTYNVTVTDANDCTTTKSFTITEPDELTIADAGLSTAIACFGDNGQIRVNITQGSIAGYTYALYQGNSVVQTTTSSNLNHTFSAPAGTYKVRVTDANGCFKETSNITLTQPDAGLSIPSETVNNISCKDQDNGSIDISVAGGTANYTYAWTKTGDNSYSATSQDLSSLSPGTYNVTIKDANDCTLTKSFTITEPDQLVASGTISNKNGFGISCNGADDGSIDLSVSGGTANYSYSWSTNNGSGLSINSQDQSGLGPGTYNVTVTDANGCTTTNSFTVTEPTQLSISSSIPKTNGFSISCFGANDGAIDITPSGGSGSYTYNWSTSNGTGLVQDQQDQIGLGPGLYTLTLVDSNNCSISQTFTINQPDDILLSGVTSNFNGFEISKKGASNGTIDLSVSGGYLLSGETYTYLWSTTNGSGLNSNSQDQTGLTAGTYNVKVTDSNGCFKTLSFELREPLELDFSSTLSNFNGFQISCFGANDGSIDITPSGGSGSYSYNWSTNNGIGLTQGQQNQSGLGPGNYTLNITDSNGNQTTGQFVLTQPNEVIIAQSSMSNYNNFEVSCFGGSDGQINITPSGGTGVYSYTWSTSNGSGLQTNQKNQSGLSVGTYTVVVKDENDCSVSKTFTLTSPSALNLTATKKDFNGFNISCNGASDGEIDITVSGGYLASNIAYTYSWSTNNGSGLTSNSEDQTGLTAGTYTVTATDTNGCSITQNIEITEPDPLSITETISDYNGFQISEAGENDGSIDITISGGTSNYSYQWSTNNGSGLNSNSEDQTGLTAGTYTVTATDTNGCQITKEYTLNEPKELIIAIDHNANGNSVLCYGDATASIKIDVTQESVSPYDYSISGTTYLNQQYNETDLNINASTYSFINLPAGQYTVTVVDANGVSKSTSKEIFGPEAPLTMTSNISAFGNFNISCPGANDATIDLSISGGGGSSNQATYFYSWSTLDGSGLNSSVEDQSGLGPGTYTVVVKDINDCSITETFTINEAPPLTYNLDSIKNITCFGDNDGEINITVSDGTGNYTYEWSTENGSGIVQGQEDQSGLGPGNYKLLLRDGCNTFEYIYTISTPDTLEIVQDEKVNILCHDDSTGLINITVSGGTAPYNYVWKDNFGNVYDRNVGNVFNDGDLSNIPSGVYDLTVTDANGCIATFSTELTQPEDLVIDIQKTDLNCYNSNNGTITITPSGGIAPYSYSWSDFGNGNERTGLAAGIYTVNITDSNGCAETRTIEIENADLFDVNPVVTPISCFGADDGSIELNFEGGVSPITFIWNDDSTAGQNRYNLSPGIYSVLIQDSSGCEIERDFTIIEPQEISIAGVITNAIDCDNPASGSIDLQISGGNPPYTFQWSNGATTEDISGLIANNYLVKVTDSKGCSTEKEFVINRQEDLEIDLSTNLYAICETREVYQKNIVSVSGGVAPYVIQWSNGIVTGNNNEIMDTKIEGSYQVTVTDALGCSESIIFDISTPEIGFPDFSYDSFYLSTYGALAVNDAITFNNLSTEQYFNVFWDFGDGNSSQEINPSHTYTKRGVYDVTLTVEFILGCSYSITKTIYVGDSYEIVIPNAFTPNNDGYNDTFRPIYYGFKYLKMQIFDTWGNLIYSEESTSNELIGWNGRISGKDGENGNYFYQVSGNTHTDEKFSKNGAFTLIK